ncbi:putative exonuclease v protein [Botrytis fragariae]|uniref:Putative exonuclease v protein n=1 Tax=Botrytis fragariae TaxID=1964551 RepID=A0A8H6ELF9_9HELO|nr:putative exonuclease v protein [Botrytis fragariae]KAF5876270.1 putative exonuclease v protein [Botrytis fragariae]
MAGSAVEVTGLPPHFADSESDYGSDFSPEEVEIVEKLLSPVHQSKEPTEIEDNPIVTEIEYHEPERALRLPRVVGKEQISPLLQAIRDAERVADQINASVSKREYYPDLQDQIPEAVPAAAPAIQVNEVSVKPTKSATSALPDTRSPLERFRTAPKKPLSVTDLVSPAWCELQYWYTLTKLGRRKQTPAMKQGSAVHKVLEDQVHRSVQIEIQTKEDAWGLRIWNVIQGLRTLRETGQTRELEIWGTIDGLVVNGIIDELSYICPDVEMEVSLLGKTEEKSQKKNKKKKKSPPAEQVSISDFFKGMEGSSISEATRIKIRKQSNKVYICDVKTRGVRTLPNDAAFRPTRVQLMLYHHLLGNLATNSVDFSVLAARYGLDTGKAFSDTFIAQVGSMNEDDEGIYQDALEEQDDSGPSSSQDSMSVLLAHNNLNALWSVMISEFQITFPDGAGSLGRILKTEYRSRDDGEIVGIKTIPMDNEELSSYLEEELRWWKGERKAKGVQLDEAFKCRSCDFAEGCEWRLQRVVEATEKARMMKKRGKKSVV